MSRHAYIYILSHYAGYAFHYTTEFPIQVRKCFHIMTILCILYFSNALFFSYFEGHNIFDGNDIIALTSNELEGAKALTGIS